MLDKLNSLTKEIFTTQTPKVNCLYSQWYGSEKFRIYQNVEEEIKGHIKVKLIKLLVILKSNYSFKSTPYCI